MAKLRLLKPRKEPNPEEVLREEPQSALGRLGGRALSSLHAAASPLSALSRNIWGTVNGLAGMDGGYGNTSLTDSNGGIELSHVLGNLGVLPKNDPNTWDWMDPVRGAVDIVGDPLTWLPPAALTKAGMAASKGLQGARLAPTMLEQIARGQRGLVGFRVPLAAAGHGAIGTGRAVAKTLQKIGDVTGLSKAVNYADQSPVAVFLREKMSASRLGRKTYDTQSAAKQAYGEQNDLLEEAGHQLIDNVRDRVLHGQAKYDAAIAADKAAGRVAQRNVADFLEPSDLHRIAAERGIPKGVMRDLLQHKDTLHQIASDYGIKTGTLGVKHKQYTKYGPKRALVTKVLDKDGNVKYIQNNLKGDYTLRNDPNAAKVNYLVPNPEVSHVPRYVSENAVLGSLGSGRSQKAMSVSDIVDQGRNPGFGTMDTSTANDLGKRAAEYLETLPNTLSKNQKARKVSNWIEKEYVHHDIAHGTDITKMYKMTENGHQVKRTRWLADYIVDRPDLAKGGWFNNDIASDVHRYNISKALQIPKAKAAIKVMGEKAMKETGEAQDFIQRYTGNTQPPTIKAAADKLDLQPNIVAERAYNHLPPAIKRELDADAAKEALRLAVHDISQKYKGQPYLHSRLAELAEKKIPGVRQKMVLQLHLPAKEFASLTGFMEHIPSEPDSLMRSYSNIFKAGVLAHPQTHIRNAISAGATALLKGHMGPSDLAAGVALHRGGELPAKITAAMPEIVAYAKQHGISETEALRRRMAVHVPMGQTLAHETPFGQIGTRLEDAASNVPGAKPSRRLDYITEPIRTMLGYDESGVHKGWRKSYNPVNVAGAFGRKETDFAPALASQMLAENIERPVRMGSVIGLMRQGYSMKEAKRLVGEAQVNYDPREFSQFEKKLKQYFPFYSFNARQGKHVLQELTGNPGGRMSQVVTAQDRVSGADESIPDHVTAGTHMPLTPGPDGTKRFVTGFGLAHEPAVRTLGALAQGVGQTDINGFRDAAYDVLSNLNPAVKIPLEAAFQQSFFKRGQPQMDLVPNIGQTLANIGKSTGLRDSDQPVTFPGSGALETALQLSPLSRVGSTARTLSDTRKALGERIANVLSGLKIEDVSPKTQTYTLIRKAEELAKRSGGHVRSEVYFSKAELEALRRVDPQLAAQQERLQKLLSALKKKQKGKKKAK